jgi:hypothetical protein
MNRAERRSGTSCLTSSASGSVSSPFLPVYTPSHAPAPLPVSLSDCRTAGRDLAAPDTCLVDYAYAPRWRMPAYTQALPCMSENTSNASQDVQH